MAKLILVKREENPWNSDGDVLFAYWEGTPGPLDWDQLQGKYVHDGLSEAQQRQDAVADRAGLQRWFFTQAV